MATASTRAGLSWSARLLIGLALILAGAATAAWALARYDQAARFLGVTPEPPRATALARPRPGAPAPAQFAPQQPASPGDAARIAELETRLARVETAAQRVEGSAGRADALLVAFAARRAIDRGVALGYLEPLLLDRFGATHRTAVATIVTASRSPVPLNDLVAEYRGLGPQLRSGAPTEGWLSQFQRELGSLIQIRHADRPSTQPDARFLRALSLLEEGEVQSALAETMRLPGALHAQGWVGKARQYVAAHRALDEIESAALLARNPPPAS
jgi:hypothetical protein